MGLLGCGMAGAGPHDSWLLQGWTCIGGAQTRGRQCRKTVDRLA